MFGFNLKSRKAPTGGEMMGFQRSFSTGTPSKTPVNLNYLNFDLNINGQKRFSNPNFVNKNNPNLLSRSQSAPMRISTSTLGNLPEPSEDNPRGNLGVVSSSPICIAVSTTPNNEITIAITPESFGRKTRLNSDCASEDSFIIFDCGSDCGDEMTEEDESDEECFSDDDNEEGTEEESDVDEVDFVKKVPFKKVRFCDKPLIHRMIKWDYAYRAARKGPWEEHVRDRCRFENRVSKLAEVIGPILNANHRTNVFNERFRNQNHHHPNDLKSCTE